MPTEGEQEFEIKIEYDEYLTRFDIEEILTSIDRIIESELIYGFTSFEPIPPFRIVYPYHYQYTPELSYIGIRGFDRGSLILTVIISTVVARYVARRFRKGVDQSLLAEELQRSGRLVGDALGSIMKRINDWAEKYIPHQRELGGKVKNIKIKRKGHGE